MSLTKTVAILALLALCVGCNAGDKEAAKGTQSNNIKSEAPAKADAAPKAEAPAPQPKTEVAAQQAASPAPKSDVAQSKPSNDTAKKDVEKYVSDLKGVVNLEVKAINAYDAVSGKNYTTDEKMYNALIDTAIPTYRTFIDKLEAIRPKNDEIKKMHEIYIDGANLQMTGFMQLTTALEEGDMDRAVKANESLTKGRKAIREWTTQFETIAAKNGISLK